MIHKLRVDSLAISLLLPLFCYADHHKHQSHHEHKIENLIHEKLAEVKAQEKTGWQKFGAASLQIANQLSWIAALGAAATAGYFSPSWNSNESDVIKFGHAAGLFLLAYVATNAVIKTTTAAVMSQEGIKPLQK